MANPVSPALGPEGQFSAHLCQGSLMFWRVREHDLLSRRRTLLDSTYRSYLKLAQDGLEREFNLFNWIEGDVCTGRSKKI
jgi:hypothetical protein